MACVTNGEIDKYKCGEIKKPPTGWVYAPYVELNIKNQFVVYSGNHSFPREPHKMVISSMQYALQSGNGGMKVDFEIVGEGANAYKDVVEASAAMGGVEDERFNPIPANAKAYNELFKHYDKLYEDFGHNEMMHDLRRIRDAALLQEVK